MPPQWADSTRFRTEFVDIDEGWFIEKKSAFFANKIGKNLQK
jgi:hypothetical protein